MVVLDASVILKWIFSDEESRDGADRFKDQHISGEEVIAVPDLFFYEIANVLATKTRVSEPDGGLAFSLLWDFGLERFDLGLEDFLSAMSFAKRHKISLYDAAYIELARRLKCRLITADKRLYQKINDTNIVALL